MRLRAILYSLILFPAFISYGQNFDGNDLCRLSQATDYWSQTVRSAAILATPEVRNGLSDSYVSDYARFILIYQRLRNSWNYVKDPAGIEYFAKASESIALSYSGDCDDFAVTLASLLMSVGARTRVVIAFTETSGHAFAEVYCGNNVHGVGFTLYGVSKMYSLSTVPITSFRYRTDANGGIWLNLDYIMNSPNPGSDYFPYLSYYNYYPGTEGCGLKDVEFTYSNPSVDSYVHYVPAATIAKFDEAYYSYLNSEEYQSYQQTNYSGSTYNYQAQKPNSYERSQLQQNQQRNNQVASATNSYFSAPRDERHFYLNFGLGYGSGLGLINEPLEFGENDQFFSATLSTGYRVVASSSTGRGHVFALFIDYGAFNISRVPAWRDFGIKDVNSSFVNIEVGAIVNEWLRLSIGRGHQSATLEYYDYLDEEYSLDYTSATIGVAARTGVVEWTTMMNFNFAEELSAPYCNVAFTMNVPLKY